VKNAGNKKDHSLIFNVANAEELFVTDVSAVFSLVSVRFAEIKSQNQIKLTKFGCD